jgi:hypothetical protein
LSTGAKNSFPSNTMLMAWYTRSILYSSVIRVCCIVRSRHTYLALAAHDIASNDLPQRGKQRRTSSFGTEYSTSR